MNSHCQHVVTILTESNNIDYKVYNSSTIQDNIYIKTISKNHIAAGLLLGFEPAPPAFIVWHSTLHHAILAWSSE